MHSLQAHVTQRKTFVHHHNAIMIYLLHLFQTQVWEPTKSIHILFQVDLQIHIHIFIHTCVYISFQKIHPMQEWTAKQAPENREQLLWLEHGSETSHPFRKQLQNDGPTNQLTTEMKIPMEVTLPILCMLHHRLLTTLYLLKLMLFS